MPALEVSVSRCASPTPFPCSHAKRGHWLHQALQVETGGLSPGAAAFLLQEDTEERTD